MGAVSLVKASRPRYDSAAIHDENPIAARVAARHTPMRDAQAPLTPERQKRDQLNSRVPETTLPPPTLLFRRQPVRRPHFCHHYELISPISNTNNLPSRWYVPRYAAIIQPKCLLSTLGCGLGKSLQVAEGGRIVLFLSQITFRPHSSEWDI